MEKERSLQPEPEKLAEKVSELGTPVLKELPSLHRPVREDALHPKNAASRALISVSIAYITALVCALAHTFFLWHMDNMHVQTDKGKYSFGSAFWIKGANNLCSKAVAAGLSYVASVAMLQVSWRTIDKTYTPIGLIDDIFSLPSPLSTLNFVRKFRILRWLPTLVLALLVNLLIIVSTFAPSSLTTGAPDRVFVSSLDPGVGNVQIDSQTWEALIPTLIAIEPKSEWVVPDDCKQYCDFQITYPAPRLSCSDLTPGDINLPAYNQSLLNDYSWYFYQTTSNYSTPWGKDSTGLILQYRQFNATYDINGRPVSPPTGTVGGQQCHFSDDIYTANFNYYYGDRDVTTTLAHSISYYRLECNWNYPETLSDRCKTYSQAARLIRDNFIAAISGPWRWVSDGVDGVDNALQIQDIIDYTNETSTHIITVTPQANLSQALEETFADLSLNVLMQFTANTTVTAEIWDEYDGSVWHFNRTVLWGIYAPAFTFVLAAAVYGLYAPARNGTYWDRSFSTIFIATRSRDLDTICSQEQQTIRNTLLRHDGLHGQFIAHESTSHSPTTPRHVTLTQTTAHTWAKTIMLGGYGAAAILAIGHHFLLWALRGHDSHYVPQWWIRGVSNLFSTFVVICLGIAASFSLTQANWRTLKLHSTDLNTLNALHSLPQVVAILELARAVKSIHLFYVAVIAVLIQALVLISLLAPGALESTLTPSTPTDVLLPQLDFSSTVFAGSNNKFDYWTQIIDQVEALSASKLWDPPNACQDGCHFSVSYSAPMLTCRDIHDSELTFTPYNNGMGFNTNWTFYSADDEVLYEAETWKDAGNPSFLINYTPITFQVTGEHLAVTSQGQQTGSICTCRDGTYNSTFVLSGNKKTITTNPPVLGDQLSTCSWNTTTVEDATQCGIYAANSLGVCQTFADNLAGEIGWDGEYNSTTGFVRDGFLLGRLFDFSSNDTGDGTFSFQTKGDNFTTAIVDLFDNMIIGLLPRLKQTANITTDVFDDNSVWVYKPRTLWAVYSPGFAAVLAIMAYGFYCIHSNNKTAYDLKFSTIMITTRTTALDDVYQTASSYEQLMTTELKFDKQSGTFVPVGRGSEDSLEEK